MSDEAEPELDLSEQTLRPSNVALQQQRIEAWHPILDPEWMIYSFLILAVILIPTGFHMQTLSDNVVELRAVYDALDEADVQVDGCRIGTTYNAKKSCIVEFEVFQDMTPPILVYYELSKFHQNHRSYSTSRDDIQLTGITIPPSDEPNYNLLELNCSPLLKLGNQTLNPCGLIANTFFNDIILLENSTSSDNPIDPLVMIEEGIAWQSDIQHRFKQPSGFQMKPCPGVQGDNATTATAAAAGIGNDVNATITLDDIAADDDIIRQLDLFMEEDVTLEECQARDCCSYYNFSCTTPTISKKDGQCYAYHYPDEDTTRYLYETYPDIISPLEGVTNEHFIVWMRIATLPTFRKLYGYIEQPIAAGSILRFAIESNYVVESFGGSKALIVSTTTIFGGANPYLGPTFYNVGFFCLAAGMFFAAKHWFRPRKLASRKYLHYKEE